MTIQQQGATVEAALAALQLLPTVPDTAMGPVLHLIARIPEPTQQLALTLMARKLATDFAYRFLVLFTRVYEQEPDELPLESENVQQLVARWVKMTASIAIETPEQFARYALSVAGLQMMMEAVPADAKINWVYDSGIFFEDVILEAGYGQPQKE